MLESVALKSRGMYCPLREARKEPGVGFKALQWFHCVENQTVVCIERPINVHCWCLSAGSHRMDRSFRRRKSSRRLCCCSLDRSQILKSLYERRDWCCESAVILPLTQRGLVNMSSYNMTKLIRTYGGWGRPGKGGAWKSRAIVML